MQGLYAKPSRELFCLLGSIKATNASVVSCSAEEVAELLCTGAKHGQELPPERMEELILAAGRTPRQRTTLYGTPPAEQQAKSYNAAPLSPVFQPTQQMDAVLAK